MKALLSFTRKELSEEKRSGRLAVTLAIFFLFGIMNPAVAKLTPWILELMADSLAESGMSVTPVTITALDSWVQFFKNMPIALIAFVLLHGSSFTKEYSSGTLILALSRGFSRSKVVISKAGVLSALWSIGYFICFLTTFIYNSYYWDNGIAKHLGLSVMCWWLFGVLVIALITLFSTVFTTSSGVLLGTGGAVFSSYILSLIPNVGKYLPTHLTDGNSLIYGIEGADAYIPALIITVILSSTAFAISIPIFNKKQL